LILSRFFLWLKKTLFKKQLVNNHISEEQEFEPEELKNLEKVLKTSIGNQSLYVQALTHRSHLESNNSNSESNERLEFLGDSVLSLVVAQYFFENFPGENEGFLTKIRAKFVNRKSLVQAAESIGISDFIIIGDNLSRDFLNNSKTILADTLEAIIGAIYLDKGLKSCRTFIYKVLIKPNIKDDDYLIDENYKSQLLEYTQAEKISAPLYEVVKEEGPQHERIFTVRVSVGNDELGTGKGMNKKTAEQNAARLALKKIRETN
jgi:ribonuclease III